MYLCFTTASIVYFFQIKTFCRHFNKKKQQNSSYFCASYFLLTVFYRSTLSREQQLEWLHAPRATLMTAVGEACVATVTWKPAEAPQGQQERAWGSVAVSMLQENSNRATPTPQHWPNESPAPPHCAQWTKSSWQTWKLFGEYWPAAELMSTSSQKSLDRWGINSYFSYLFKYL